MSFIATLWGKLRKNVPQTEIAQQAFDKKSAVSQTMKSGISLWYQIFTNQPPWADGQGIQTLGLASSICREIARPVFLEFDCKISGSERADFLQEVFDNLVENLDKYLEVGLALGGITLKPYIADGKILIDTTTAMSFQPTKYNQLGKCIGGVFKNTPTRHNNTYYTKLEYHELTGTTYTVKNKAYECDLDGNLKNEVPLHTIPEWENIEAETIINNVSNPLFACFVNPNFNNLDTNSKLGMSIYNDAIPLLKQADEQWQLMKWEFESSRRKIFIDGTVSSANQFERDLFVTGVFSASNDTFREFNPTVRGDAFYKGFQNILKQIEYNIGLSFGTISDPMTVAKTATEIVNSNQRMNVLVRKIQRALTYTFEDLVKAVDTYATLYNLSPIGAYEMSIDWGDNVLNDIETQEKEFARDLQLCEAGIINTWEVRMKWLNEDEETAKKKLQNIDLITETLEEAE